MVIVYDFITLIFTVICLPVYLFKRKFHPGFARRLGILPPGLALDRPIWIHAVSVGEARAVERLLGELRVSYPGKKFVISTVTATGNQIVRGFAGSRDFVTYLPLDFSFIVRRVINRINPCLFLIAETEIWPNLISCLYRKKIPVVVVNGRISDRSFKGYAAVKFLLKPVLNKVTFFCAQTSRDAERLSRLGVPKNKIEVTGNLKFDSAPTCRQAGITEMKTTEQRKKLGLTPEGRLLIAASTHKGEEEIILGAYKELLDEFTDLRLLIAPRHPERAESAKQNVSEFGFRAALLSGINLQCPTCITPLVFILDTIGDLISFYAVADIVFVGGSLIKKGGHNILEPAALSKPILFGPHMFNFRDIQELFLENKAAILVRGQQEFKEGIAQLLNNPSKMAELGARARKLILENQGAASRTIECIRNKT